MRVVIAPDSFTGTLSAVEAAAAMAAGWRRSAPGDELDLVPLSDGGPGFVDVLHAALGGRLVAATVTGPLGAPVEARFLLHSDEPPATGRHVGPTAYVESAQACGLHLVPADRRDPTVTTTAGVGELVAAAVAAGARRVVVGLGGSGTTDGGAGLLAALGARARARDGADVTVALGRGGGALGVVDEVDLAPALAALRGVDLVLASDVDSPLLGPRGAARGFGPQKGADADQVEFLEQRLHSFAGAVGRRADGKDPAVALGAGAAGGLGFALLALGGGRVPGIATVLDTVRLANRVAGADLVLTGEGSFDWQSLRGKVVAGVAEAALASARPVLVLAGRVQVGRREWVALGVAGAYAVTDEVGSEAALADPAEGLARLATRVAQTWSRPAPPPLGG